MCRWPAGIPAIIEKHDPVQLDFKLAAHLPSTNKGASAMARSVESLARIGNLTSWLLIIPAQTHGHN